MGNKDVFNFRSRYPSEYGGAPDNRRLGAELILGFETFALNRELSCPFSHLLRAYVTEALNTRGLSNTCLILLCKSIF
jgi:hypothetical protein